MSLLIDRCWHLIPVQVVAAATTRLLRTSQAGARRFVSKVSVKNVSPAAMAYDVSAPSVMQISSWSVRNWFHLRFGSETTCLGGAAPSSSSWCSVRTRLAGCWTRKLNANHTNYFRVSETFNFRTINWVIHNESLIELTPIDTHHPA